MKLPIRTLIFTAVVLALGAALWASGQGVQACGGPCPTPTTVRTYPTATRVPPTQVPPTRAIPTATQVPPTRAIPTATSIPPTPVPTTTAVPPTPTQVPLLSPRCEGQNYVTRNALGVVVSTVYSPQLCLLPVPPPPPPVTYVEPPVVIRVETYCASNLLHVDRYFSNGQVQANTVGACPITNPPPSQPITVNVQQPAPAIVLQRPVVNTAPIRVGSYGSAGLSGRTFFFWKVQ